jgi:hypothetical protein
VGEDMTPRTSLAVNEVYADVPTQAPLEGGRFQMQMFSSCTAGKARGVLPCIVHTFYLTFYFNNSFTRGGVT